jgi:hypothetical protein
MTLDDATHQFETYTRDNFRVTPAQIASEVARLAMIAEALAKAIVTIAPVMNSLDTARLGCDRSGLPSRVMAFRPSECDEYATVEGVLWGFLTPEAECLVKVMLHDLLRGA